MWRVMVDFSYWSLNYGIRSGEKGVVGGVRLWRVWMFCWEVTIYFVGNIIGFIEKGEFGNKCEERVGEG